MLDPLDIIWSVGVLFRLARLEIDGFHRFRLVSFFIYQGHSTHDCEAVFVMFFFFFFFFPGEDRQREAERNRIEASGADSLAATPSGACSKRAILWMGEAHFAPPKKPWLNHNVWYLQGNRIIPDCLKGGEYWAVPFLLMQKPLQHDTG